MYRMSFVTPTISYVAEYLAPPAAGPKCCAMGFWPLKKCFAKAWLIRKHEHTI
jgi:hypothetical protein